MLIRALPTSPSQANALARQFVVGQTLNGIVLRTLPEGQTLVNFAGQHVLLELAQPIARGQTFVATVEQTSPSLVLKLLDTPPSPLVTERTTPSVGQRSATPERGNVDQTAPGTLSATRLKPYLAAKQPFGEMVAALQRSLVHHPRLRDLDPALLGRLEDTLAALLPHTTEPPDADGLKAQVDRSGINYEAKVREALTRPSTSEAQAALANDLKGQLLELLHKLDQRPTAPPPQSADRVAPRAQEQPVIPAGSGEAVQSSDTVALREQVQQALRNIEFQQLSNLFTHQENHSLLLQFAHPAFPAAHTARLYFRVDGGDSGAHQDAPPHYTLVLLLDFSALGSVRVDATVRGSHVAATIRTADAAVADFITAETPTLITRLHDLGFQAEVRSLAQAQVPLEVDDSLTRLLLAAPSGLVDVKA
jgi:hypothetical protein